MTSLGWRHSEVETKCGLLLNELQLIWDEIGEDEEERDQMLLELELQCLEVYRCKVTEANRSRANMHQKLADIHREIVAVASELGDHPPMAQLEKRGISLKEQLHNLEPILEEIRTKKDVRRRSIEDIRAQIHSLQSEIYPSLPAAEDQSPEQDLTLKKLDELQVKLRILQKEKDDRLYKVMDHVNKIHGLCKVLGCDFFATVREVHPSLDDSPGNQAQSISDETIERLSFAIQILMEEKRRRMQQIQDLGASLLELWNLLDTPGAEQHRFQHVTCNIAAAEHEFVAAGALSLRVIEQAQAEVEKLENLKASKMKELVFRKRNELEEICKRAHIVSDGLLAVDAIRASMESGSVDPAELLASIEEQIAGVREESFSRKEIMDKIEKWLVACEEENWLDEYNKDEHRYNATRGAHLNMKRAERARVTVSKIPALLESLVSKVMRWEEERGKPFLYDGVRLLSTIDEYKIMTMDKEEEKRRHRDQRRLQEQTVHEQETSLGTRPSPTVKTPTKKGVSNTRFNAGGTPASIRRLSLGGAMLQQGPSTIARLNGNISGRNTLTPSVKKESSSKFIRPTVSANEGETTADDFPSEGKMPDLHLNIRTGALPAETHAALRRMPFSPVATPDISANANTEDHTTSTQEKAAILTVRSPSDRTSTTFVDEENMTPLLHTSVHEQQVVPPLQFPFQLQQSRPDGLEYSFEERRLQQQQESQLASSWTICR